jgi:hypothetical protein
LIFAVEEYFKSTHNFRGISEVNGLIRNKVKITPYSFVQFANSFDFSNLIGSKQQKSKILETTEIGHTGINAETNIHKYSVDESFNTIPNDGIPEISGGKIKNVPLKDYVEPGSLKNLRSINATGFEKYLKGNIKDIIQKLNLIESDLGSCNNSWNNKNRNTLFFVNFFPTEYYKSKGYLSGQKYITPSIKLMDFVKLDHEPFIRIFSNDSEGCTVNTIGKKNNFKIGKPVKKNNSFGMDSDSEYLMRLISQ